MTRAAPIALLAAAALAPAAQAASPGVWAHRGGSYVNGKATYPENTLPAFTNAARHHWTLELDVHLSKDGVLFVIHDDTLDRTTPCTGTVEQRSYASIARKCRSDVLGSPGGPMDAKARMTAPKTALPTLAAVLAMAKERHAAVAPELKEYDPTGASARALARVVKKARFPVVKLVVQSFFPQNLAAIKPLLPGVRTLQLTIGGGNAAGIDLATSGGNELLSPQWPVDADYVQRAHAAGLIVAPYTLDTAAEVKAAAAAGVDDLMTDDPAMATRALKG